MHVEFDPAAPAQATIDFDGFLAVDIRVGTVVAAEDFPEARKPSYKLKIDFGGGVGIRRASAQITRLYGKNDLIGRQVLAVVNFPPRQIANAISEVLVLGLAEAPGAIALVHPDRPVPNGTRLA